MTLSHKIRLIIILIVTIFLAGCATQAPHFRLDSSLQKDVRTFSGVEYVPLVRLCDVYGLDYKWDSFIKTVTIQKKSNCIVLRSGSDRILVNGVEKKLCRPIILSAGAVFIPTSFAKNMLGLIIGAAPSAKVPEISPVKKFTIDTIVLDPGHGGKDPGAIGRKIGLREKELTLALAKRIKSILQESGIKVIMTRENDAFISLPKRAEIANRNEADLFVSVHINASRARSMRGFECYYLSNATDDNARAIEAFENASLKMQEGAEIEHSEGLDKTLWDMNLSENRLESAELASYICDSVNSSLVTRSRGVKSARFYVLKYTHMPSVLIETAYISNKYEEMELKGSKFLDRIADAVAEGILKYKKEYEYTEGFTKT